jgi:hypothetical protein
MADVMEKLTASMATSASGYAAVIDGLLNVKTTSETANGAAFNALHLLGHGWRAVFSGCSDIDCDCKVRLLAELCQDVKIVPVKVEAA